MKNENTHVPARMGLNVVTVELEYDDPNMGRVMRRFTSFTQFLNFYVQEQRPHKVRQVLGDTELTRQVLAHVLRRPKNSDGKKVWLTKDITIECLSCTNNPTNGQRYYNAIHQFQGVLFSNQKHESARHARIHAIEVLKMFQDKYEVDRTFAQVLNDEKKQAVAS